MPKLTHQPAMGFEIPACLRDLKQHADAASLDHLDMIINATLLDYPLLQRLAELDPPPLHTPLLEGTPEHALAAQGPVHVRVFWAHTAQVNWLGAFVRAFERQSRVLSLLSPWPFDALSEHLRYYTQAHWDKGAKSGILRYYDNRLFKHISGVFIEDAARDFHAPVISWHWTDRDHKAQIIGGDYLPFHEFTRPRTPLMMDAFQVESVCTWSEAEQWEKTHGLSKRNYRVGKEQLVSLLYLGHLAASDLHLEGEEHRAFMIEWLARHLPEDLPQNGGWA